MIMLISVVARAGETDDGDELALLDAQVDVLEDAVPPKLLLTFLSSRNAIGQAVLNRPSTTLMMRSST